MNIIAITLCFALIIFSCYRMLNVFDHLTKEQRERILQAKRKPWRYIVYIGLIVIGILFITFGGLPLSIAAIVYVVFASIVGIWMRFKNVKQYKSLHLPKSFLRSSLLYFCMMYAALLGIVFSFFLPETFSPPLYVCPNTSDLQGQLQFMKPGDSKLWSDNQNLVWTISVPSEVIAPPRISHFFSVKWSADSRAVMCGYNSAGSKAAIYVYGSFDVDKPDDKLWQVSDNSDMVCMHDLNQCRFSVNAS